jgi:hypothetical protein
LLLLSLDIRSLSEGQFCSAFTLDSISSSSIHPSRCILQRDNALPGAEKAEFLAELSHHHTRDTFCLLFSRPEHVIFSLSR